MYTAITTKWDDIADLDTAYPSNCNTYTLKNIPHVHITNTDHITPHSEKEVTYVTKKLHNLDLQKCRPDYKHQQKETSNINFTSTTNTNVHTIIPTNVLLTTSHGNIQTFQGYCIDSEASRTLVGEPQFKSYEKFLKFKIQIRQSPHSFRFGARTHQAADIF